MFAKKDTPTLDTLIDECIAAIDSDTTTEDIAVLMDRLERLHAMKSTDRSNRVKPDTLALIAGNLAGIMLIVGHERAHVVTSKALGFVSKLK